MRIINLLPKKRQKEIRYVKFLNGLFLVMWISLASFAVVFILQFMAKAYLQGRLSSVEREIEQLKQQVNKQDNAQIKAEIVNINNKILDSKNLAESSPKWSKVLKAFAVLPPDGVRINSFNVDPAEKVVTIRGFAPTRELAIELYDIIKADSENFYNVNYPLENLVKATDVSFYYKFYIRESLLK